VLRDDTTEGRDVLKGTTHEERVSDTPAVIGKDRDSGFASRHPTNIGELHAVEVVSDGANRSDLDKASTATQLGHHFYPLRCVRDRRGVGHGVDCSETAGSRRSRAGQDRFGRLAARFAQMRVQVDQSGKGDESCAIDDSVGFRFHRTHLADDAIVNQNVGSTRAQQ
jgi:hypothetical protein